MSQLFNIILYQPLYNLLILLAAILPGQSIGLAIIVLTLIIRVILLPNSLKAARLQVKNMELQPEINRIRNEIKDKQEQSRALMDLYKREGASPLGSCLPLLIQMPILIAMFRVFKTGLDNNGGIALYSFIPKIEDLNTIFLGVNLNAIDPWILPISAAVLQLWLSFMMMPKKKDQPKKATNDPMEMMSKQMLYFPAVITIFFGKTMPAGLVVYWIATTLFSIGQQWYINREIKNKDTNKFKKLSKAEKDPTSPTLEPKNESPKKDLMAKIVDNRLQKKAKKAGVNVVVRTKK